MDWTQAEAALEIGVASVFDRTAIRIVPRKEGSSVNQGRIADPARAAFDAFGTIERGGPALPSGSRNAGDPSAQTMQVFFEAVLTAHVADWPYIPVRGDRIEAAAKVYDIAKVDLDGSTRVAFHLNTAR